MGTVMTKNSMMSDLLSDRMWCCRAVIPAVVKGMGFRIMHVNYIIQLTLQEAFRPTLHHRVFCRFSFFERRPIA